MTFKVNHLHCKTPDPEKTAKWYQDYLGATIVSTVGPAENPIGYRMDLHGVPLNVTKFVEGQELEQFYGLEYESCCWGLRLVTRRYISTRDGTRDSSIGLQLVLKGMTSVGTAADKLLERGILGYSPTL